eukprot:g3160.t1
MLKYTFLCVPLRNDLLRKCVLLFETVAQVQELLQFSGSSQAAVAAAVAKRAAASASGATVLVAHRHYGDSREELIEEQREKIERLRRKIYELERRAGNNRRLEGTKVASEDTSVASRHYGLNVCGTYFVVSANSSSLKLHDLRSGRDVVSVDTENLDPDDMKSVLSSARAAISNTKSFESQRVISIPGEDRCLLVRYKLVKKSPGSEGSKTYEDYSDDDASMIEENSISETLKKSPMSSRASIKIAVAFESLGVNTDEGRATRTQSWMVLDRSGDGRASYSETIAWVRKTLIAFAGEFEGEKLFKKYYTSFVHAYSDAKQSVVAKNTHGDFNRDNLQRSGFKRLCVNVCIYAAMYDAFGMLNDDEIDDEETDIARFSDRLEDAGSASKSCVKFVRAFEGLGADTDEGRATRTQSWMVLDRSGDGRASYSETIAWVRKTLIALAGEFEGEKLFKQYYPSFVHAFQIAAGDDEYVKNDEFQQLCDNMCIYAAMYDAFETLNIDDEENDEDEVIHLSDRLEDAGSASKSCVKFVRAFEGLGANTDEGRATRTQSWMVLDRSGDGRASYSETIAWVRKTLIAFAGEFEGEKLFKQYYPSFLRAFQIAAGDDEYVEKSDFERLCSNVCIYAAMYDAFETLNIDDEENDEDEVIHLSDRLEDAGSASKSCSWMVLDRSGDGRASYSETIAWVRKTLIAFAGDDEGESLFKTFHPSFIHAFYDAVSSATTTTTGSRESTGPRDDEYVRKSEFERLCSHICMYATMFDVYISLSKTNDASISTKEEGPTSALSEQEWTDSRMRLSKCPFQSLRLCSFSEGIAKATFRNMDKDSNGVATVKSFFDVVKSMELQSKSEWARELEVSGDFACQVVGEKAAASHYVTRREWDLRRSLLKRSPFQALKMCSSSDPFSAASFEKMDADEKGYVTFPQFCEFVTSMEIQVKSEWGQALEVSDDIMRRAAEASAAGSHYVTRREWDLRRSLLKRSPFQALKILSDDFAKAAYTDMDTNGTGMVSIPSFVRWLKSAEISLGSVIGTALLEGSDDGAQCLRNDKDGATRDVLRVVAYDSRSSRRLSLVTDDEELVSMCVRGTPVMNEILQRLRISTRQGDGESLSLDWAESKRNSALSSTAHVNETSSSTKATDDDKRDLYTGKCTEDNDHDAVGIAEEAEASVASAEFPERRSSSKATGFRSTRTRLDSSSSKRDDDENPLIESK